MYRSNLRDDVVHHRSSNNFIVTEVQGIRGDHIPWLRSLCSFILTLLHPKGSIMDKMYVRKMSDRIREPPCWRMISWDIQTLRMVG